MSTWLASLQTELESLTDTSDAEPRKEVEPTEHIVDTADEHLRKLYFLVNQRRRRCDVHLAAAEMLTGEQRATRAWEAARLDWEADVIEQIFWISCRDSHEKLRKHTKIGIRKGWKLVWIEDPKKPSRGAPAVLVGVLTAAPPPTEEPDDRIDPATGKPRLLN